MEIEILLSGNEVKVYYQNLFQKVTSEDFNRLSGAESTNSIVPALLSAILATINRDSDTAIGFEVSLSSPNTISVSSGIFIRTDSVFIVPALTLTPDPNSRVGIYEIALESSLTDEKAVPIFNSNERFQPQTRPTRKTFRSRVFEQSVNSQNLPTVSPNRIGLLSFQKTSIGDVISNVTRTLPVYDPKLIGIDVNLDPGILDNESLASAINWIYNHLESKDFLKTTPSPGSTSKNWRVRTQGNFSYWSDNEGATWLPFA